MVNDDIAQMSEGLAGGGNSPWLPKASTGAGPDVARTSPGTSPNGDLMTVVARYQGSLLRYVGRMLGTMGDQSEDVVQETFIRLHRQVSTQGWDSIKHPTTWLFQVAHNLTLDVLRQRKRRPGSESPGTANLGSQTRNSAFGSPIPIGHSDADQEIGVPGQEMDALGEAIRQEARHAVLRELSQLEEQYRQVILLKIIQGMSLRQAAEVVGVSLTTVNSRLNQGLSILAQRLRRAGVV
jgi:RNA polymerase sigma-70 factor (ECF subfamily)